MVETSVPSEKIGKLGRMRDDEEEEAAEVLRLFAEVLLRGTHNRMCIVFPAGGSV